MIEMLDVPTDLARFLDELVAVLREGVELEGAYLIGSAALGAYEQGRSDVDVYAVVAEPLPEAQKQELEASVRSLHGPARQLELVVYTRAEAASPAPRYELNTGDPAEGAFWFVLDRAAAESHAVPLVGPPWGALFAPVPRADVVAALRQSLDWQERADPLGHSSVLNAVRSWRWLETGDWVSKPQAAAWLRDRVRARLEEER